jgi:phenylpyruvate tautomerase PptA (4-oxalocrotonate tautomerase family)
MPILDVEIVGPIPDEVRAGLAARIADAAAAVLSSPPHGTWVKLRFIDAREYAENGGGPTSGVEPVLVSILQAKPLSGPALAEQAARLTTAIATACRRPAQNVQIVFQAPAAGRVSFGGKLIE